MPPDAGGLAGHGLDVKMLGNVCRKLLRTLPDCNRRHVDVVRIPITVHKHTNWPHVELRVLRGEGQLNLIDVFSRVLGE
eukprot:3557199-Pyramimonas_sp.AAC.1